MAGDWIKVEVATSTKPEVYEIADALGMQPDEAFGKLVRLWCYFDQNLRSGNDGSVTTSLVDRITGKDGFGDALLSVGWLERTNKGLRIPNFDRHNGQTAKKRALTARRVALHKKRNGNASVTLDALPREEKRREVKAMGSQPASSDGDGAKRTRKRLPATPCPTQFEVTQEMSDWAVTRGLPSDRVMAETEQFLDHHRGRGQMWHDWHAAWRKWIRKAVEFRR
jgi:hypothetical protein